MRKIIVLSFISLDGIMQAPGGPEEDHSGDFQFGGWSVPFAEETSGKLMVEQMSRPFDLLLGRRTYDIFASYWPKAIEEGRAPEGTNSIADALNNSTKYVVTQKPLTIDWKTTIRIDGDVAEGVRKIKN